MKSEKELEQEVQKVIDKIEWNTTMLNRFSHSQFELKHKFPKVFNIEITDLWMKKHSVDAESFMDTAYNFINAIIEHIKLKLLSCYSVKIDPQDELNFFKWWRPLHEIGALDAQASNYAMGDKEILIKYCKEENLLKVFNATLHVPEYEDISLFQDMFKKSWIYNQSSTEDDKVDVDDDTFLQYAITLLNASQFDEIFLDFFKTCSRVNLSFKDFTYSGKGANTIQVENYFTKMVESVINGKK